ncbi:MAG: nuclear transport factor 2 family protein [Chitinophagaceae bacterium]|nr:nuclear transport factor 2 family protein [Chitinophagaceae bacterium]MCB9056429.1 nuclear transport factor 2 family protein [Chitinophagales bacterium]
MKRNLVLFLMAGSLIFVSCESGSGGMSAAAKKNLAANDSIGKIMERGDFEKLSEYIAADAVDHAGEQGDIVGLDNIMAEMKKWKEMMPDMKSTMNKSMADDEYVFTWSEYSGTMNGKPYTSKGMDVAKFKDGKAVEHWMYMDPKDMAMMMAPPPPPAMADSTAK